MDKASIYNDIVSKKPIKKGFSVNTKYCVTTSDGTKYLLRIMPASQYETNKALFTLLEQATALGIPMCIPIEFGTCNDGVYIIQSWILGEDLGDVIHRLSEAEQYMLGVSAGKILRKIHSIPVLDTHIDYWTAMPPDESWEVKYNRQLDNDVMEYQTGNLHFDGDVYILDYIRKNRQLLSNRSQCYGFDDFNIMNMMLSDRGLVIIDFERYNIGDPWEEFSDVIWSVKYSHHFATGQIHGYFDGEPPEGFFRLLALYFADYLLAFWKSQPITSEFWRNTTLELSQNILKWFNNMKNPVPTWYLNDLCI